MEAQPLRHEYAHYAHGMRYRQRLMRRLRARPISRADRLANTARRARLRATSAKPSACRVAARACRYCYMRHAAMTRRLMPLSAAHALGFVEARAAMHAGTRCASLRWTASVAGTRKCMAALCARCLPVALMPRHGRWSRRCRRMQRRNAKGTDVRRLWRMHIFALMKMIAARAEPS